jgi:hypothetical protein
MTGKRKLANAIAALGTAGALVAGSVAVSGCGASATLDPIAQAAVVSSQQSGVTLAMTMQFSSPALPGGSYAITANGTFDELDHTGQMTMDLSGVPGISSLGGGNGQVQMRFIAPDAYMNMPFLAGKLPTGKTWIELDLSQVAAADGLNASSLSSLDESNPTQFLEYLRGSSGEVVSLGSETVEGVPTTHYHATLQLSRILEKLPSSEQASAKAALEEIGTGSGIPVEVWIDAQGRVRRMQMSFTTDAGAAGVPAISFSITMAFKSYGPVPAVVAPPAGEVYDASTAAASELSSAG